MQFFSDLVKNFEQRLQTSLPFAAEPVNLYEPCRYLLALGGKRVRPILCLMANELFGEINEDAWHAAIGIELFHNFTLIHDDIMDKAPLRRGHATIHEKYGMVAGILSGDVMNIYACDEVAQMRQNLQPALRLFHKTAIEVCEGQQLDMDYEQREDVTMEEYLHMITLKTSVLLACALKLGALAGNSMGDSANKLYDFGKFLGIAFQLQDDYLDAFGDGDKVGKQIGGDIAANKKTILLVEALELADGATRLEIKGWLLREGAGKVPAMLELYRKTGADEATKALITRYADMAFDCLEDVAIPSVRKQPLRELAQYLLLRDK